MTHDTRDTPGSPSIHPFPSSPRINPKSHGHPSRFHPVCCRLSSLSQLFLSLPPVLEPVNATRCVRTFRAVGFRFSFRSFDLFTGQVLFYSLISAWFFSSTFFSFISSSRRTSTCRTRVAHRPAREISKEQETTKPLIVVSCGR